MSPLSTVRPPWAVPGVFSSPGWTIPVLSACLGEAVHPSENLHCPPLQQVLPVLGTPEPDAVLQMGTHQSRAEGENHFPCPAGTPILMQPRMQLPSGLLLLPSFSPTEFSSLPLQGYSQWVLLPVCTHIWDCPDPGVAPWIWICWTSLGLHWTHFSSLLRSPKLIFSFQFSEH